MKEKSRKKKPYLFFIAPGFIAYTVFIILPIIYVIYLSVFEWSGLGEMNFIGIENFKTLFTNTRITPVFWNALKNNLKYLLCVWFIITPFQFLVAYLFYLKIPFFKYYKFMIFMPYVISSTIVSFFATMMFNPTIGFLNTFFEKLGLHQFVSAWVGDPKLSFKIMIALVIWQGAASGMMIFYANMMDIPQDIIEASRIDGCSEGQRLTRILIPSRLLLHHCHEFHLGTGCLRYSLYAGRSYRRGKQFAGFREPGILQVYLRERAQRRSKPGLRRFHQRYHVYYYHDCYLHTE